jgi:hypothetical protein
MEEDAADGEASKIRHMDWRLKEQKGPAQYWPGLDHCVLMAPPPFTIRVSDRYRSGNSWF